MRNHLILFCLMLLFGCFSSSKADGTLWRADGYPMPPARTEKPAFSGSDGHGRFKKVGDTSIAEACMTHPDSYPGSCNTVEIGVVESQDVVDQSALNQTALASLMTRVEILEAQVKVLGKIARKILKTHRKAHAKNTKVVKDVDYDNVDEAIKALDALDD